MLLVKLLHGRVTVASMKSNEQVITSPVIFLFDADAVAEAFQNPRPAQRRHPIAVARSRRRGCDDSNSHQAVGTKLIKLNCAGAKARPDVTSIGRVEISVVIPNQPRACHPAAATQHFMIAVPRL